MKSVQNQSKIPNSSFHSGSRLKKSYFPNVAITYYVKHVLSVKHVLTVKGRSQKKKTGKCGNFSQVGDPPPLPPVWEPHVCEKKIKVYFAF